MDSTALVSRQQMVEDNLGLVRLCAHRLGGRGVEYDDCIRRGASGCSRQWMPLTWDGV